MNIREIAKLAQVSPSTVSRALNNTARVDEETRARVLRVIEEAGYVPNSMKRHEKAIALIVPDNVSTQAYWAATILDGVMDGAGQHYVTLMRIPPAPSSKTHRRWQWREHARHAGLCGVIVIASAQTITADLRAAGMPYVVFGRGEAHEHWVWCENVQIVHQALDHLHAQGRKSIAFAGHCMDQPDLMDRLTAYRTWTAARRLPTREVLTGDDFPLRLKQLVTSRNRPDALFVSSLNVSMWVIHEFRTLKINIPEELGFATMAESPLLEAWSPPPAAH